MSERELQRIEVLSEVLARRRSEVSAAAVLGLSTRQTRRLLRAYRDGGGGALIHKSRGRGITDTPMLREHLGSGAEGEQNIRKRLARVPSGKILTPQDIAQAALYLVSNDSVGVSGVSHIVDGGLLAAAEYDVPL